MCASILYLAQQVHGHIQSGVAVTAEDVVVGAEHGGFAPEEDRGGEGDQCKEVVWGCC